MLTPERIAETLEKLRARLQAAISNEYGGVGTTLDHPEIQPALAALVAFERAEAQPCRSIRPPCDPLDRFGVCSRCTALAAIIEEALHADPN